MKKYILFLTTIFISTLITSCDGGNYKSPELKGTWTVSQQVLQTNYPDIDIFLKQALAAEAKNFKAVWDIKDATITVERTSEAGLPGSRAEYEYYIENGFIYMKRPLEVYTKVSYLATRDVLMLEREVDQAAIGQLLYDMGAGTAQTLPDDIKGVYKIMAGR